MRRMAMLAGTAAVALFASTASAQAKVVNFAGKWVVVDSTTLGRGGRGGFGQTVTFVQDAGTLTVVRVGPNGEVKSIYKLDGSESKNTVTMRGAAIEESAKAMWMADTLMVATSRLVNGATVGSVMHLYLDASGNLVVATTAPARGGGPEVTTKVVYKKGM
jgi:hypothetical protein